MKRLDLIIDALERSEHIIDDAETPISKALAAARSLRAMEPVVWMQVSDALPKSGVKVLAYYKNSLGNSRRIRAMWIAAKTEESGSEDEFFEYDEETDTYYLPEGWYECINNWDDYSSVKVYEGEVTYWMSLPPAPDDEHAVKLYALGDEK